MHRTLVLACLLAVAGCTEFPEFAGYPSATADSAEYPDILPMAALMETLPSATGAGVAGNLAARAAGLRQRADWLRGPVVDYRSRSRLMAAVARHAH